MFFAETQGMGMGLGLIATSIVTRGMFAPVIIYSVSGLKTLVIRVSNNLSLFTLANCGNENEATLARSG